MTEIAVTTSLIAFGLIVAGCFIGAGRDFLRSHRDWRANRERWMRFLK